MIRPEDASEPGRIAILTRPAGQSAALAGCLETRGWEVCDWPALLLTGLPAIDIPQPSAFDLVVFVSGNAVRFYFQQLATSRGVDRADWPRDVPAAVVGPASAQAVHEQGGSIDVVQPPSDASSFDSEALWAEIKQRRLRPRKVLVVRGGTGRAGSGRGWLAERFASAGAEVQFHAAYRRAPATWPASRLEQLRGWRERGVRPVWQISSREGLAAIVDQLGTVAALEGWKGSRVVVGHWRIALALRHVADSCGVATASWDGPGASAVPGCIMIQTCIPRDDTVFATIVN